MIKSDVRVQDPQKRPICPKVSQCLPLISKTPSRFRRKKQFEGDTTSPYNGNFRSMPKNF